MSKLADLAKVLRSKNSGPFAITLDVLFDNKEAYERVKRSEKLSLQSIAALYKLKESEISDFVWFDAAMGLKVTFLRRVASGTVGDRDVYGSQQHAPLLSIEIP